MKNCFYYLLGFLITNKTKHKKKLIGNEQDYNYIDWNIQTIGI